MYFTYRFTYNHFVGPVLNELGHVTFEATDTDFFVHNASWHKLSMDTFLSAHLGVSGTPRQFKIVFGLYSIEFDLDTDYTLDTTSNKYKLNVPTSVGVGPINLDIFNFGSATFEILNHTNGSPNPLDITTEAILTDTSKLRAKQLSENTIFLIFLLIFGVFLGIVFSQALKFKNGKQNNIEM